MKPTTSLKVSVVLFAGICVIVFARPHGTGQNKYLPPEQGYNYYVPEVPFPEYGLPGGFDLNWRAPTYLPPIVTSSEKPTTRPPTSTTETMTTTETTEETTTTGPTTSTTHTPSTSTTTEKSTTEPHEHHHEHGMPFGFEYAVSGTDPKGWATDHSHRSRSDGDEIIGEYRVLLPDGRTQVVRYTADWATGYHARVRYEGAVKRGTTGKARRQSGARKY